MKQIPKSIFLVILFFGLIAVSYFLVRPQFANINTESAPAVSLTTFNLPTGQAGLQLSTLIVPHHDLVKDKRSAIFSKVKDNIKAPKTIILMSTNHFDSGNCGIISTKKEWQTDTGNIESNNSVVADLVNQNIACDSEAAFEREHGIKNILSDIQTNFPKADLVPIIVKPSVKKEQVDALIGKLEKNCEQCLLVASVDFSHYQPAHLAQLHDDLSIRALTSMDESLIWQAEVDSNQALYASMMWAKAHNTTNFHLEENTNSGFLNNNFDVESTSYVLGWYEQKQASESASKQVSNELSFIFAGDMLLDRDVDYFYPDNKILDVFSNFGERVFWGTDISILNNEGPISSVPIPHDRNHENLSFNFTPKTPSVLNWLHINAVSLANNHTLNQGAAALAETKIILKNNGIIPIGQDAKVDASSIHEFKGNGISASIITLDALNTNLDTNLIKKEKAKGNKVIIFPHWGTEYLEYDHTTSQANLSHSWIDAGADLVIGSHPHVVEDIEIYKNIPIIYSLGNFLFDQTFSIPTQQSLIVAGKFTDDNLELIFLPTVQKNLKPQLVKGETKKTVLDKLFTKLNNSNVKLEYDKITINN